MKIIKCEHNDAVWHATRLGRVTASNVKHAMAFGKDNKPLKARSDYMMKLLCERLTGETSRNFVSPEMEHGTAEEKFARAAYEVSNNVSVDLYGIAIHRDFDWFAASPDGIIEKTGGAEFKCPTTIKHLTWKLYGILPDEHIMQCHAVIDVWELDFLDFYSYDGRLPAHLAEFQAPRLWRDDKAIADMHEGIKAFNQELDDWIGTMNSRFPPTLPTPKPTEDFGEEGIGEEELKYLDMREGVHGAEL